MVELFSGTNREKFREYHFLDELFQPQTYQPTSITGNLANPTPKRNRELTGKSSTGCWESITKKSCGGSRCVELPRYRTAIALLNTEELVG
jgi:hypothetical protein